MTNQVTVLREDKKEGSLNLNGLLCHFFLWETGRTLKDEFTPQRWFTVWVCYPHNMSSFFKVQAATVSALVKKLEKMDELWPYSATGRKVKV